MTNYIFLFLTIRRFNCIVYVAHNNYYNISKINNDKKKKTNNTLYKIITISYNIICYHYIIIYNIYYCNYLKFKSFFFPAITFLVSRLFLFDLFQTLVILTTYTAQQNDLNSCYENGIGL